MAANQPGLAFDIEALAAAQRRGLDAFTTASRITVDGLQTCMRRQFELTRELMEDMTATGGSLRGDSPQDMAGLVGRQIQQMSSSLDRSLACGREVSEILVATQREALEVLQECCRTNIAELRGEVGGPAPARAERPAAPAAAAAKPATVAAEPKPAQAAESRPAETKAAEPAASTGSDDAQRRPRRAGGDAA